MQIIGNKIQQKKYIDFGLMNCVERHTFNKLGYADEKFVLSESEFNKKMEEATSEKL